MRLLPVIVTTAGLATAAPALADRIKNPTAVFSGLDKITGRIISFEAAVDEIIAANPAQVEKALAQSKADKIDDIAEIEQIVVDTVSTHLRRTYRREPAVMAVVIDS